MPSLSLNTPGQHIVLVGSTGSGKSEFAQTLLNMRGSILAIDTQDSLDKLTEVKTFHDPHGLGMRLKFYKRLRYIPKGEYRDREWWNFVFETFLHSSSKKKPRPRTLYIDEIYHIGYGISFPNQLPRAITTARQRKLSFVIATQRPRQIPMPVLSEASKIIVFYLSKFDDRKVISQFVRKDPKEMMRELEAQEDDYSFLVIDNRKGTYEKYPPIKL